MNIYLIPSDPKTVDSIAISIAKDRIYREAQVEVNGINVDDPDAVPDEFTDVVDQAIDAVANRLWNSTDQEYESQKDQYRQDAIAAIRSINLQLMQFK